MGIELNKIKKESNHTQTIGDRVKFYRLRLEMSQLEVESKAGLSTGTISRIESNQISPSKETLFKIGLALNMEAKEIAYIFGLNFYLEEFFKNSDKS